MNTCTTIQRKRDGWRRLAAALGDGRTSRAELGAEDIRTAAGSMISLLGAADHNVRIGTCRLVTQNTAAILQATEEQLLVKLRGALLEATTDWAPNDYVYGGFQCAEEDVRYVTDEARAALSSLSAMAIAATEELAGHIPRMIRGRR